MRSQLSAFVYLISTGVAKSIGLRNLHHGVHPGPTGSAGAGEVHGENKEKNSAISVFSVVSK
jgi:hypothetical protein